MCFVHFVPNDQSLGRLIIRENGEIHDCVSVKLLMVLPLVTAMWFMRVKRERVHGWAFEMWVYRYTGNWGRGTLWVGPTHCQTSSDGGGVWYVVVGLCARRAWPEQDIDGTLMPGARAAPRAAQFVEIQISRAAFKVTHQMVRRSDSTGNHTMLLPCPSCMLMRKGACQQNDCNALEQWTWPWLEQHSLNPTDHQRLYAVTKDLSWRPNRLGWQIASPSHARRCCGSQLS